MTETVDSNNKITVAERIKSVIRECGMPQYKFAESIGVDVTNLSKYLNGKLNINDALINKIVVTFGISKQWLTTGEGSPQESGIPHYITIKNESNIDTNRELSGTPVYNIDVTAGPTGRSMIFTREALIGSINMPSIPADSYIVKVSGDSMQPVVNNGDLIAVRPVTNRNLIFWGQIYVILLEDYRMVKYVRRHEDPNKLILRSENPDYDDIEVDRSDVIDMMIVTNIIHIDSRI